MKRTAIDLADGRELIYFDERDDAVRDQPDRRDLPPPPPASQLRYDPLTDEWVAVAAHRQTRTFLPPAERVPARARRRGDRLTEIPAPDYDVVVFENRFPSLSGRVGRRARARSPRSRRSGRASAGARWSASPRDHNASFASLPPRRVRTVLDALADRTDGARRRCPAWSRSSASRTGASRSASRCTTRTGRSTRTPS